VVVVVVVVAIYTAAMEMLAGSEAVKSHCRSPDIMADAAYAVLTSDSGEYTGHFDIDEDLLRRNGVTDFQKYSYEEGKCCTVSSSSSSRSRSSSNEYTATSDSDEDLLSSYGVTDFRKYSYLSTYRPIR